MFQLLSYWYVVRSTLFRCQGTTTTAQQKKMYEVCRTMQLWRAHDKTIPLGRPHRYVVCSRIFLLYLVPGILWYYSCVSTAACCTMPHSARMPPSTTSSATGFPTVPSGALDIACRGGNLLPTCCYSCERLWWDAPALLLFDAVSAGPLAGVSLSVILWYRYRIIVYRYRYRITEIVSVICFRIAIER